MIWWMEREKKKGNNEIMTNDERTWTSIETKLWIPLMKTRKLLVAVERWTKTRIYRGEKYRKGSDALKRLPSLAFALERTRACERKRVPATGMHTDFICFLILKEFAVIHHFRWSHSPISLPSQFLFYVHNFKN